MCENLVFYEGSGAPGPCFLRLWRHETTCFTRFWSILGSKIAPRGPLGGLRSFKIEGFAQEIDDFASPEAYKKFYRAGSIKFFICLRGGEIIDFLSKTLDFEAPEASQRPPGSDFRSQNAPKPRETRGFVSPEPQKTWSGSPGTLVKYKVFAH